jgi:hypothetical protein
VEGVLQGSSLGSHPLPVKYTGRLFDNAKSTEPPAFRRQTVTRHPNPILEPIGSSAENWWAKLETLSNEHMLGRFFAAERRIQSWGAQLFVSRVGNRRNQSNGNTPSARRSMRSSTTSGTFIARAWTVARPVGVRPTR